MSNNGNTSLLICSPELKYSGAWARYKASFLSSLSPLEVLGITHLRKKCEIAKACSQKESQECYTISMTEKKTAAADRPCAIRSAYPSGPACRVRHNSSSSRRWHWALATPHCVCVLVSACVDCYIDIPLHGLPWCFSPLDAMNRLFKCEGLRRFGVFLLVVLMLL